MLRSGTLKVGSLLQAYLALLEKGYSVRRGTGIGDSALWLAVKGDNEFIGDGLLELLGIVCMCETRGENWKATDKQIEEFLKKYEIQL